MPSADVETSMLVSSESLATLAGYLTRIWNSIASTGGGSSRLGYVAGSVYHAAMSNDLREVPNHDWPMSEEEHLEASARFVAVAFEQSERGFVALQDARSQIHARSARRKRS